jgi:prepilin-type N-terminal cleavage/methylation domain-containing protein
MLDTIKNRKEQGFTIVEVMIVLAIAGLVILIVFLAVPALQRNSRNTQRKADVSSILGATNEYRSNHNGKNPTAVADVTGLSETGFYDETAAAGTTGSISLASGAQAALTKDAANDRVVIVTSAKCGTGGATVLGPPRSTVVQYLVETSTSYDAICQEG